MNEAIVVKNVSKLFKKRTIRQEYTTFKSELVKLIRRPKRAPTSANHLTALLNINLSVHKGQTFGLLGRNGSGKSTLLKLVTGIYSPTSGTVEVNGRISALLELGAGFHPEFSGRENILMNGIILGMSRREIRSRVNEIVEFSEIGDFIDEPVRTYSSGMYARLAFSIATHVDPEILIIDEILAVGDEHFARKSAAKMDEFRKARKTILLVTHDLNTLQRRCDAAAWLDGGILRAVGDPADIVAQYRQAVAEGEAHGVRSHPQGEPSPPAAQPTTGPGAEPGRRWGSFEMELSGVRIADPQGETRDVFGPDSGLNVAVDYFGAANTEEPILEVAITRVDGLTLWSAQTGGVHVPNGLKLQPSGTIELRIGRIGLGDGTYNVDVTAYSRTGKLLDCHRGIHSFVVRADSTSTGLVRPPYQWVELSGAAHSLPAHPKSSL